MASDSTVRKLLLMNWLLLSLLLLVCVFEFRTRYVARNRNSLLWPPFLAR